MNLLRRVPLRRKPQADPVPFTVRSYVIVRDGGCLMVRFDPRHVCRDRWGVPHAATTLHLLTVDHVKDESRMGKRAPSDVRHLVALCHYANVGVPSKDFRAFEREYLAGLS